MNNSNPAIVLGALAHLGFRRESGAVVAHWTTNTQMITVNEKAVIDSIPTLRICFEQYANLFRVKATIDPPFCAMFNDMLAKVQAGNTTLGEEEAVRLSLEAYHVRGRGGIVPQIVATTPVTPGRRGVKWDREEEESLIRAYRNGKSMKELASAHDRTLTGIREKLIKLGEISP